MDTPTPEELAAVLIEMLKPFRQDQSALIERVNLHSLREEIFARDICDLRKRLAALEGVVAENIETEPPSLLEMEEFALNLETVQREVAQTVVESEQLQADARLGRMVRRMPVGSSLTYLCPLWQVEFSSAAIFIRHTPEAALEAAGLVEPAEGEATP